MKTRAFSKLSAKTLAFVATLLSLPFLAVYWASAGCLIAIATNGAVGQSPILSFVLFTPLFLAASFFRTVWGYVLTTIPGLLAAIAGLIAGRTSALLRVWLLVLVLAIAAFPFVFRYQPALTAAPGYQMQWVTAPGFPERIVRAAQNILEETPCRYELMGWTADGWLYYRATCAGEERMWRYSPAQPGRPAPVSQLPEEWEATKIPESQVLAMVRADIRPKSAEPTTRPLLMKEIAVFPDGRWIAIVTRHIYGPEDIVVLREMK